MVIPVGEYMELSYKATYTDEGVYSNTVKVTAQDDDLNDVYGEASAELTVDDVKPTVDITKTATPSTRAEPGGVFTFKVTIKNTSVEDVIITAITDDYPLPPAALALIGTTLTPGQEVSFSYTVTKTEAGSYKNTASVTVKDNENNNASDSDDETIIVTDVKPTITITKTPCPTCVLFLGGWGRAQPHPDGPQHAPASRRGR